MFYFIKFLFIVDGFILPCDNLRDTEKVLFHIIKNEVHTKEQWLSVYEKIDQFYSFVSFPYFRKKNIFLFLYIFRLTMEWNNLVPLIFSVVLCI